MVQNVTMRLDHVSYVTSHNQLADTVQRLGSRLGCTFVDGGIHPRFGTRNFTCALKNNQYIEVVCPLDHPSTEQTPWGSAVSKKVMEGGGWFTWVFSTEDISSVEERFGRTATEGHRTRPDGTELKWLQIGVKEIVSEPKFPYFIQWLTNNHPASEGAPSAELKRIVIADSDKLKNSWFERDIMDAMGDVQVEWIDPLMADAAPGIVSVEIRTPLGLILLD
jgi:hypothetical protein